MSQYKQYYMVYQGKDWEMLPDIHQGMMNSWQILEKFLKEEEIVRYYNGWNPLSSKPQIKKIKEYYAKKREVTKEEASVASTSKPQANPLPQEGKKSKKNNWRKPYSPSYSIPKIQRRCHGQCLKHGQNLDRIQGQGGTKSETTSFPKGITFSPDVVNTLT
ncbi:hypothetical protein O181_091925 [Austropuccinia psidii MF-1]|uniref:Uncharacterized protein n=1 Tax=Austropuccinia psidii MF-1 TaxID=1389203 RepID=A0A9Q3IXL1_9BASI|nr:hypothetical protein [Austropuccinia psidii MF-1]